MRRQWQQAVQPLAARAAQAAWPLAHLAGGLQQAFCSAAAAASAKGDDAAASATSSSISSIHVACVLERLPVVAGPPPACESEHHRWLTEQEIRHGLRSDYPHVKHIYAPMSESSKQHQQQGGGEGGGQAQGTGDQTQPTAAAGSDAAAEQVPLTPADQAGDKRSMRRALASRLYLLVRQGRGGAWQFPQAALQDGESLRQACERALVSTIGRRYPFFFIGNAPMAHVELPKDGGRLFFMLAQVVDDPWGRVQLAQQGGASDYAWATREEAQEQLAERSVAELVPRMLLP